MSHPVPAKQECIDFRIGHPFAPSLPLKDIASAVGSVEDVINLQYGALAGSPAFREEVSKFLSNQYGAKVQPDEIVGYR